MIYENGLTSSDRIRRALQSAGSFRMHISRVRFYLKLWLERWFEGIFKLAISQMRVCDASAVFAFTLYFPSRAIRHQLHLRPHSPPLINFAGQGGPNEHFFAELNQIRQ